MEKDLFTIKGNKRGLTIIFDDKAPWPEVLNSLQSRLQGKERDFLRGAKVTVDVGARILKSQEAAELWSTLEDNDIVIKELHCGQAEEESLSSLPVKHDGSRLPTLVVKRSLRSGQKLSYDGNVVLLGDVNPGAEIESSGFIIVWGDLRGTVHAGITGDIKAWVAAQRLQPTQLRIAQYITRAPEEEPQEAEIAEVIDNMIVVRQLKNINKGKHHADEY